jgi:hypothetical protein
MRSHFLLNNFASHGRSYEYFMAEIRLEWFITNLGHT